MKSIIAYIKNTNDYPLPYEHNYVLSIAIYDKLQYYQKNFRKLHSKEVQDGHTISSVIPSQAKYTDSGITFARGFFIVRSFYDDLIDNLRLSLSIDNRLKIGEVETEVTSLRDSRKPDFSRGSVEFKSLSPSLVRDSVNRKQFRTHLDDIPDNLSESIIWNFRSFTTKISPKPVIQLTNVKRKTVRVSRNGEVLGAVLLNGTIIANPDLLDFTYFKGIGSKTGLGLGCWEVVK